METDSCRPFSENVTANGCLLREMKQTGKILNDIVRKKTHRRSHKSTNKQFIIAGLFSEDEIKRNDFSELERFSKKVKESREPITRRFIQEGRSCFILNNGLYQVYVHGEARLLDPDGQIRRAIGVEEPIGTETDDILQAMKDEFKKEMGDRAYVIAIYSHLLPCAMEKFQCAKVLAEYMNRNRGTMIVGYQDNWKFNSKDESLEALEVHGITLVETDLFTE